MEVIFSLFLISGIIFLGFFSELIFKKFNIPDVLLLILIGILISFFLEIDASKFSSSGVNLFTTFALIFILFQGALNINFKILLKSLSKSVSLTLMSFVFTVFIVFLISLLLGFPPLISLLLGAILGGTSSAVVIPVVNSVDIKDKYSTILQLESALSDVIAIISTITILEILSSGGGISPSGIFRNILSSFSLSIIVGFLVGIFWILIKRKFDSILSNSYMLTIAVVVALYSFVESPFVGASGAIASLTFGLVLGNSRFLFSKNKKNTKTKINADSKKSEDSKSNISLNIISPSAKNFYSEISFFVKTFFFVYLGLLVDFSNPIIFFYGFLLTLGIYLIRPLIVHLLFSKDNLPKKERIFLEILIPKGLAAAVLAGLAVQSGTLGDFAEKFSSMVLSVVILSILFTSILIFLSEKPFFKGLIPIFEKEKN